MNVLWIMTDQHRADCLGYTGHPLVQTPNLDRLAREGIVFENAFCQSPVCMSSRACLMTGRYPAATRVRGMGILPPTETTLPTTLRRQGFQTAAFGKVHLTPEQYTLRQLKENVPLLNWRAFAKDSGFPDLCLDSCAENYGFGTHLGYEDLLHGRFHEWLSEQAPHLLKTPPQPGGKDYPSCLRVSPYPSAYHPSTFIATKAAEFIRTRSTGNPWMTYCSFVAPHDPFEAPAEQIARYDLESIPLPEHKGGVCAGRIPKPAADAISEMNSYSEEIQKRIVLHYLASISLIDDGVGHLIDTLEQSNQLENTIIVFNSDHGEFLGNHGLLRKPSLHYDETLRVPLFIRMPKGNLTPRSEKGLVELTDLYPTLLGLLDIPCNEGVQGQDWSEALRSNSPVGREDIYADMFDLTPQKYGKRKGPSMAVQTLRTNHWKLNLYPTAGREYGQLFDLRNDPEEAHNLYGRPEQQEVTAELLWRLLQRCHLNTDPLPPLLTQY